MSAAKLYTPEVLGLAVELARYPELPDAAFSGDARSPACGSTLAMQLDLDPQGRISRLGMRVRACAVGQASAAIFARQAVGKTAAEMAAALAEIESWLSNATDSVPAWTDLHLIAAARSFPGRHGAMLLPWKAALSALSNAPVPG